MLFLFRVTFSNAVTLLLPGASTRSRILLCPVRRLTVSSSLATYNREWRDVFTAEHDPPAPVLSKLRPAAMTKCRLGLTPGGTGVLDLAVWTVVQRLVARRLGAGLCDEGTKSAMVAFDVI